MKKEVDTYKLRQLFDVFKHAMLWAWYLGGVIIGVALWFFPMPQTNIQTFAWAGVLVIYSAISVAIAKVDRIRGEFE